jgi:hypothetical protein
VEEAAEEVLAHRGPVLASMIGGQWALVPAGVPGVGVEIA